MIINGGAINRAAINGLYGAIIPPSAVALKKTINSIVVRCVITGSPDIVIPISNINGELVADGTSSIAIVCPDGNSYSLAIAQRITGNIIINTTENYTDGTSSVIGSDEYAITYISQDQGANSFSVSVRGKRTFVSGATFKYAAISVSAINTDIQGRRRVRLDYNSDLRINDILLIDDSELVVGRISYVINSSGSYMYVSET